MRRYVYKKSDAFTSENSLGNPAACIYMDKDSLSEEHMLDIAKQHKGFVSEFVFCSDSDHADCKLTYYSSECEVDFCGHGTIAAMYELIKSNESLKNKKQITIQTNKKGVLALYNEIDKEDAVYITAPTPEYLEVLTNVCEVAQALGVQESTISKEYPLELINAGLRTLIVPICTYQQEISIFPCEAKLKEFVMEQGIDIVLIFSMETSSEEFIAHTRVFAPKFGYLEDPATGSGNSAFGYYMYNNKIWSGEPIAIEQGGNDRVYNAVKLLMKSDKVLFGGKATLRIDGHYIV